MFHYRFFQHSPEPIFCTAPDGTIIDANRAFLDLYGLTPAEVRGKTPRVLKSSRQLPSAYAAMWRSITDPAVGLWTGEVTNRRKDGAEIVVQAAITAVRRADGGLLGFVATHQDITGRKALEERLRVKNRELERLSELKSEFVAITSHDLKSPLSAIVNHAEIIRESLPGLSREKLESGLARIVEEALSLARFVDGLLDLRQIETGTFQLEPERVRLERVLSELITRFQGLAQQRHVDLAFVAPQTCTPPVLADPARLEQVFANLVGNAIKFAPAGTRVEVTLEAPADGAARVYIRDHGTGIPPEELQQIFRPFYQVQERRGLPGGARGHGLGLSIAHQIVAQHGGSIVAANAPDGGALFTVELPRRAPRRSAEVAAVVYDPRQELCETLVEPLRRRGAAAFVATSPQELARTLCFEHPELLLLDAAGCGTAVEEICRTYRARNPDAVLACVAVAGDAAAPSVCGRLVTEPVSDLEVFELLDLAVRPEEQR